MKVIIQQYNSKLEVFIKETGEVLYHDIKYTADNLKVLIKELKACEFHFTSEEIDISQLKNKSSVNIQEENLINDKSSTI